MERYPEPVIPAGTGPSAAALRDGWSIPAVLRLVAGVLQGTAVLIAAMAAGGCGAPEGEAGGTAPSAARVHADPAEQVESLLQADRDFFARVERGGIDAWVDTFTDDAIRLEMGSRVIQGHEAIREFDEAGFADSLVVLVWEPLDAAPMDDGRYGITTGRYAIVNRAIEGRTDTLGRGSYVTLWRWEGGRWKVAMDTGAPDSAAP